MNKTIQKDSKMPAAGQIRSGRILRIAIAVLLALASYLSISGNYLGLLSAKDFEYSPVGSEVLVIDGLLNARARGTAVLGTFDRPEDREHYAGGADFVGDRRAADHPNGPFTEYKSQYGLQIKVFNGISRFTGLDTSTFHALVALMMALVIAGFFLGLSSVFSTSGALAFCLSLVTSPWVTLFGRDLYWVEFTWFLPALVVLLLGGAALESGIAAALLYSLLALSFLIKFLCGYEYVTTIVFAAALFVPVHAFRRRASSASLIRHLVAVCAAAVAAFSVAIILHAHAIEGDVVKGLGQIATLAERRTATLGSTENFVQKYCAEGTASASEFEKCFEIYNDSLQASRTKVLLRYFMITRFIPWLNTGDVSQSTKDDLKAAFNDVVTHLPRALSSAGREALTTRLERIPMATFAVVLVNVVAFIAFIVLVLWGTVRRRDGLSVVVSAAFIGSISWFLAAKGHSYIHTHLNFVLWYILFIPFGALLLSSLYLQKEALEVGPTLRTWRGHATKDA